MDPDGVTVQPMVSVIVPTRNRVRALPALLGALAVQRYPAYEVIVVDDGSADATAQVLADWSGEGRIALRTDTPAGSYAARNRGIRVAQGEMVAFTDDDCQPQSDWLAELVRAMRPGIIGVQGETRAEPGEITPFTHQIDQRTGGPPYRTCNIAYRRSILEQLGGFDGSMRWCGDNVFGFNALQQGAIAFNPNAVVLHPPRPREWRDRAFWRARFVADAKERRELRKLGAQPLAVPGKVLPVLLWIVRPLVKQSRAHARYALHHPGRYLRSIRPMAREKVALLAALLEREREEVR